MPPESERHPGTGRPWQRRSPHGAPGATSSAFCLGFCRCWRWCSSRSVCGWRPTVTARWCGRAGRSSGPGWPSAPSRSPGAVTASVADEQTLHGALVRATWHEFGGGLWWAAGLTVGAGLLIVAAATARIPDVDLAVLGRRAWLLLSRRPERRSARIGRGLALSVVGLAAALRPGLTFSVLGVVAGLVLLVAGVGEIAAASGARSDSHVHPGESALGARCRPRRGRRVVATLVAVDASPADRGVSAVAAGPIPATDTSNCARGATTRSRSQPRTTRCRPLTSPAGSSPSSRPG